MSIYIILLLCILVFFRGSSVGTDVIGYSTNFKRMNDNPLSWNYVIPFENGFNYLIWGFKKYISTNPMHCWGTLGIIYTISLYSFFRKYTSNINIALFLFYFLGTYFLSYNIMRQCFAFAITLCFLSIIDITSNMNIKKAIIFIVVISAFGILLHSTMFIFLILLLYFIPIIQRIITKPVLITLLIASFIIFYTQAIIPFVTSIVGATSIEGKLINYATSKIQNGDNSEFSLLKITLITIFQIYIIAISPNTKNIFLLSSTIGVLFLNCFGLLVVEFARVYELLAGIGIVYLAELWDLKRTNLLIYSYRYILIFYSLILFLNILTKNYGEIVPYVFRR